MTAEASFRSSPVASIFSYILAITQLLKFSYVLASFPSCSATVGGKHHSELIVCGCRNFALIFGFSVEVATTTFDLRWVAWAMYDPTSVFLFQFSVILSADFSKYYLIPNIHRVCCGLNYLFSYFTWSVIISCKCRNMLKVIRRLMSVCFSPRIHFFLFHEAGFWHVSLWYWTTSVEAIRLTFQVFLFCEERYWFYYCWLIFNS